MLSLGSHELLALRVCLCLCLHCAVGECNWNSGMSNGFATKDQRPIYKGEDHNQPGVAYARKSLTKHTRGEKPLEGEGNH